MWTSRLGTKIHPIVSKFFRNASKLCLDFLANGSKYQNYRTCFFFLQNTPIQLNHERFFKILKDLGDMGIFLIRVCQDLQQRPSSPMFQENGCTQPTRRMYQSNLRCLRSNLLSVLIMDQSHSDIIFPKISSWPCLHFGYQNRETIYQFVDPTL